MTNEQGPIRERSTTTTPAVAAAPVSTETIAVAHEPVAAPITATPVAAAPAVTTIAASSASRFEPDAFIAGAIGLVLLVIGLIAAIRAGFSGPMSVPVVKVLGATHTTTLGLIEVVIGVVLMAAAGARSRGGEMFGGIVLGVAGFIGAVQHSSFVKPLALQTSWAWIATIAGAVVVLVALLLPRFSHQAQRVEQR